MDKENDSASMFAGCFSKMHVCIYPNFTQSEHICHPGSDAPDFAIHGEILLVVFHASKKSKPTHIGANRFLCP